MYSVKTNPKLHNANLALTLTLNRILTLALPLALALALTLIGAWAGQCEVNLTRCESQVCLGVKVRGVGLQGACRLRAVQG